jgi:hypothetical protein
VASASAATSVRVPEPALGVGEQRVAVERLAQAQRPGGDVPQPRLQLLQREVEVATLGQRRLAQLAGQQASDEHRRIVLVAQVHDHHAAHRRMASPLEAGDGLPDAGLAAHEEHLARSDPTGQGLVERREARGAAGAGDVAGSDLVQFHERGQRRAHLAPAEVLRSHHGRHRDHPWTRVS